MRQERYAYVSRSITEEGREIGFMFREEWTDEDSGWRFYSGDESTLFLMEPDCCERVDIDDIAAAHPEIAAFLDSPAGSRFVRDESGRLSEPAAQGESGNEALLGALAGRQGRGKSAAFTLIAAAVLIAAVLYFVFLLTRGAGPT